MAKSNIELITDRGVMRKTLRSIRPTRIAVAYVGANWKSLLGATNRLREIVLAPIPGTNPTAVAAIARNIGWENVHFLDQLHAKLYLGAGRGMFGSANLSANAFADGTTQLYELMAATTDDLLLAQLCREFEAYVGLAKDAYRDTPAKKARLKALAAAQPDIQAARVKMERRSPAPTMAEYKVGSRAIHLEWFDGAYGKGGDPDDTDWMNLVVGSRKREVRAGNWLLEWRCTPTGRVGKNFSLEWMRIDVVRLDRGEDEDYVDQVAERVCPPAYSVPFRLDARLKKVFREQIMENNDLRPHGEANEIMPTPSRSRVDRFLRQLQERYLGSLPKSAR